MIATGIFVLLAAIGQVQPSGGERGRVCDIGPAVQRFGGHDWSVYACDDGRSVVIVAVPPNPASPFIFILRPDGERVLVYGEGSGDTRATEPAYAEMKKMTTSDLADLHRSAVVAGNVQ